MGMPRVPSPLSQSSSSSMSSLRSVPVEAQRSDARAVNGDAKMSGALIARVRRRGRAVVCRCPRRAVEHIAAQGVDGGGRKRDSRVGFHRRCRAQRVRDVLCPVLGGAAPRGARPWWNGRVIDVVSAHASDVVVLVVVVVAVVCGRVCVSTPTLWAQGDTERPKRERRSEACASVRVCE